MQSLLQGRYASARAQVREVLARPEFEPPLELSTEEYRRKVLGWARMLAERG